MEIRIQLNTDIGDLVITEAEINAIVADNLEDDVIGVENDIKDLIATRNDLLYPVQIHVHSTNPFSYMIWKGEP